MTIWSNHFLESMEVKILVFLPEERDQKPLVLHQELIQRVPVLRGFWDLKITALCKIRISGTVLMTQITQKLEITFWILFWTFWTSFKAVLIQQAVRLHIFNHVPWTLKSNPKMYLVVSQLLKSPPLILDLMSWDDDYWIVGVLVIFVYWEKISECWANISFA